MPQATTYSQCISDFTVTKKHWKSQGDESGLWGLYSDFPQKLAQHKCKMASDEMIHEVIKKKSHW